MNRSRIRKIVRRSVFAASVFFLLYFSLRSWVLDLAVGKVADRLEQSKGLRLSVGDKGFFGFSGVWFSRLSLHQPGTDTLLVIDTMAVRPALLQFLIGRIGLDFLQVEHARLLLSSSGDSSNHAMFRNVRSDAVKEQGEPAASSPGYGSALRRLLVRSFALAPQEAVLRDLQLELKSDTLQSVLVLEEFISDANEIRGRISDRSSGGSWSIDGDFSKRHRSFHLTAAPLQTDHRLPLLKPLTGLTFGFDTLHMEMSGMDYSGGELQLTGAFSVKGMSLYHGRVADDTVRIDQASFDYRLLAGERHVTLDSQSVIRLNTLVFHPFVKVDRSGSGTYAIMLSTDTVPANDFFSSLPEGMFDEVRSIRGDGSLAFRVAAELDAARPDSVRFSSSMRRVGFRLRDPGRSDIFKLNAEFVYDVFENGRFIRSFPVGPTNPDFTPLGSVSPYFRNSVLTSEDGNFFFHNGFNEEAFRRSIAENFKAGKFKRGGSTITMQLVKNVFLTRKKTVARKAEEALIVWLIESGRLVSKERLLEVYFNIIELGPDVYGIGEASRFYFSKRPDQLDLPESIFLAGLLPRPKWFKSQFDTTGALKPYVADYYRVMSNFMLRKGLISEAEHAALVPNVVLTGVARDLVLPEDTVEEELPEWIPGSGQ